MDPRYVSVINAFDFLVLRPFVDYMYFFKFVLHQQIYDETSTNIRLRIKLPLVMISIGAVFVDTLTKVDRLISVIYKVVSHKYSTSVKLDWFFTCLKIGITTLNKKIHIYFQVLK